MFSKSKKKFFFVLFLILYLAGLLLLAFTGPDGSGALGFFASLFTISGLVGLFCVLLIRADPESTSSDMDRT